MRNVYYKEGITMRYKGQYYNKLSSKGVDEV